MKKLLEAMGKKDTARFQEKIRGKNIRALEAWFHENDGRSSVIIYRCRHEKIRHFYFNEKDYFERLRYYQAVCDSLIAGCGVNNGNPSGRHVIFEPKQAGKLRSVAIWYEV